ncbi:SulP family inorganic anion transporter [Sphingomonas sp. BT-65]|uniref:SulP family inorganic anion transporter n=1 Tax=Sphingomonas sp. BT-65 TaxID=2989821 RepID=UPI0022355551|nr:SulP family inorganic anion transporter [Sphingomonas sp. BT-65]MCW4462574.1 SulP family inorganic anion transporter [Sphingomonas sp. BT-65]
MTDRMGTKRKEPARPRREPDAFTPKLFTVLGEGYSLDQFRADAFAGLTVAVVALPLAMALGVASGASPDKGLITAIVAGLLISMLGGSRVQIGGPTGAFVVVVFNVIATHGYDGLVLATLLAGIILIVAGYMRLGRLIRYIPHPVITGFTAGIAVIIASSQIKDFLGLAIYDPPADFLPKWIAYAKAAGTIDPAAAGIGAGALALIVVLRGYAPKLPAYLIVIILASVVATFFHLPAETIGSRFPDMPHGLPMPALPAFSLTKLQEVTPAAFTIAFLAGIEALLSCVVADGMTGFRHRSNQELVGQGAANFASALFGGLPATGAIARTAANVKSGGRTPVAGMLHAVFLLIFVLFASDLMAYVPMAALAAVLLMIAWGMSEAERFVALLRMPIGERGILLLTFGLTVLVDLTVAIGVGVTIASLLFMARMSETVTVTASRTVESEDASQRDQLPADVEVFRITGPFFFGVAGELLDALKRVGRMPRAIILRMELVPYLDASGVAALREFVMQARADGARVILSGVQARPFRLLKRSGLGRSANAIRYARDYDAALAVARTLASEHEKGLADG